MSDIDVRKGYRAMVSGGTGSLNNDEVENLNNTLTRVQRERGLTPLEDEVMYLKEFIKINEEYISEGVAHGFFDLEIAKGKLETLNSSFPSLNESIRRTEIIAPSIEEHLTDNGWMSSSNDC